MAITAEQFIELVNGELVADRIVAGVAAERKFLGDVSNGILSLNEAGQARMAEIEEMGVKAAAKVAKEARAAAEALDAERAAAAAQVSAALADAVANPTLPMAQ